jgi:hypothetical protein
MSRQGQKRKLSISFQNEQTAHKKIKLDLLRFSSAEENQLPDEIVLPIFRLITRKDEMQCSIVSRQWYRIGLGEEFHWIELDLLFFTESPSAYKYQRLKELKNIAATHGCDTLEEIKLWMADPIHANRAVNIAPSFDESFWVRKAHSQFRIMRNISAIY